MHRHNLLLYHSYFSFHWLLNNFFSPFLPRGMAETSSFAINTHPSQSHCSLIHILQPIHVSFPHLYHLCHCSNQSYLYALKTLLLFDFPASCPISPFPKRVRMKLLHSLSTLSIAISPNYTPSLEVSYQSFYLLSRYVYLLLYFHLASLHLSYSIQSALFFPFVAPSYIDNLAIMYITEA